MTITTDAQQLTRPEPKRDRWGRYMIAPSAGGKAVGHTRVTTFAKSIADTHNLTEWAKRNVALGMAQRPDLVALAHGLSHDDKVAMRDVVASAEEASGAHERRNLGTAIHRMCERVDAKELAVDQVPDAQRADVAAYRAAIAAADIEIIPELIERVCVIDAYTLAGTFDRIVRHNGALVVADIKTGKSISYSAGEIAIQLASYANADHLYDTASEERSAMPEVDRTRGLIIHLPAGEARCELHLVDLTAGWEACRLAADVRRWRGRKNLLTPLTVDTPAPLATEPDREPDPVASPQRREWIVERVRSVIAHEGLNGGQTAAEMLVGQWPAGVPMMKDHDGHTDGELDAIAVVLDQVEARFEIGFGPADPATPPHPRLAEIVARSEVVAAPPPQPTWQPDEGTNMPAAREDIKAAMASLDAAAHTSVTRWVQEGLDAGVSFATARTPTERKVAIVGAAIKVAQWDPDDDAARTALGIVMGTEVQPAMTVGSVLGVLTIAEARRLDEVATVLLGGTSITFDSDGVPRLAA